MYSLVITRLPARFGRYLLVDKIATGGMAEIFKAKLIGVEGFEKTVVIKRILPFWSERRDFVMMLVDEAKILVHLNHPNIVQVYELGCEEENYFIAMEYVEGIDLRHLILQLKNNRQNLPQEIAHTLMIEALKGLDYAHHRTLKDKGFLGIVHRDISPQNILLSFEGEVKVTDFGIAKAMTQTHETQTGVLKGKYAYMSPEQAMGQALDARSDLFSCGVVLYELLFDRRLFASKNDLETLEKVRKVAVDWPQEKIKSLYPGVPEVLKKSLGLRPEERFASGEEFAQALLACIPAEKRVSSKELSQFLNQSFHEEIRHRRIRDLEVVNRTRSFLRQTQVAPLNSEDTISLIETPTEPQTLAPQEAEGEEARSREAKKQRGREARGWWRRLGWWPIPLTVFALVLAFLWIRPFHLFRTPPSENKIEASGQASLPPPEPEKIAPPALAPPPVAAATASVPPPPAPTGSLRLGATPSQANLFATYPGGKKQGTGGLFLEKLPIATEVKVSASLANFETENKSFQITENKLNVEYVFHLNKKAPSFGGISINAVPWGKVSMAGFFSGNETPASHTKIPEGSYRVVVSNPALNKTVSAVAVIKGGQTTRCHADLEGKGGMYCR